MPPNAVLTAITVFVDNLWVACREFFFPRRCLGCGATGSFLCSDCSRGLSYNLRQPCLVCGRPAIGGYTHPGCESRYSPDRFLAAFEYAGVLPQFIHRAKYRGQWAPLADLALLFSLWLEHQGVTFLPDSVLVPIPVHFLRYLERGYNQSLILAEFLGRYLDLPVEAELLSRSRYTISQTQLSAKDRRANIRRSFATPSKVRGRNLVLIDDVATTGATLLEAARTLKRAGARTVWCLSLAHRI